MGIFQMIQRKKEEFKQFPKLYRDNQIHNRNERNEKNLIELKALQLQKEKLQQETKINNEIMQNRKQIRELKHPVLTKVFNNLKSNLEEANKNNKNKEANKNNKNKLASANGGYSNIFNQTNSHNPFLQMNNAPNNIFTTKIKKKR